jgi:hypothetical protein
MATVCGGLRGLARAQKAAFSFAKKNQKTFDYSKQALRQHARLIPSCLEPDTSTARKHLFLKKEAKTFAHLAYAVGQRERLINKSFLVLFLKKELLAFLSQPRLWSRWGMSQTQGNLVS